MSTIEQRLEQDIAAVTAGVVVTEADLRDGRRSVDERVETRRRRDRRLIAAAAAGVVALLAIVGMVAFRPLTGALTPPAGPDPSATDDPYASFLTGAAPTLEELNGVWRVDNGVLLLRFAVTDRSPDEVYFDNGGELYSDPRVQGNFSIEGDRIVVTVTGGRAGCEGQTFAMRASLPTAGAMRFVFTDPGTGACVAGQNEEWVLEQVLPTGEALSGVAFPSADPGWEPVRNSSDLIGVWLAQGGGYVLELGPTGSYYVAGESGEPVDLGQWSLQDTELTLTSTADWRQCLIGDRLVLRDVELVFGAPTRGLRGTVAQNACGGPWATKTWVRFPDG